MSENKKYKSGGVNRSKAPNIRLESPDEMLSITYKDDEIAEATLEEFCEVYRSHSNSSSVIYIELKGVNEKPFKIILESKSRISMRKLGR